MMKLTVLKNLQRRLKCGKERRMKRENKDIEAMNSGGLESERQGGVGQGNKDRNEERKEQKRTMKVKILILNGIKIIVAKLTTSVIRRSL